MQSVNKVPIQQQGCWLEEIKSSGQRLPKDSHPHSTSLESFSYGYDELNLAEFPLAAIADRHPSGEKTKILTDTVWDRKAKRRLPRRLMISGSNYYGLPTAKDDDVLLACIQLGSIRGFDVREVFFSRYELLKLLRWKDSTRDYQRLATSLRRWLGVSIYSDRAFFDRANQSWVNRDFGIFDNLNLYERERDNRGRAYQRSSWRWNEVILGSFQAGYLKRLDWELYCGLSSAVAKRLYRFLDKRFYHGDLVIGLEDLALRKLRLSPNYNTSQIKRALRKGIEELEAKWDLVPMDAEKRYLKKSHGTWEVVFKRKRYRLPSRSATSRGKELAVDKSPLLKELSQRGVGQPVAKELISQCDPKRIQATIELFDWYNARSSPRQPGFLVSGIRSAEPYVEPPGFESSARQASRKRASDSRNRQERKTRQQAEQSRAADEKRQWQPFLEFWNQLDADEQAAFEQRAVAIADQVKRDGYERNKNSKLFEEYRQQILRACFEQLPEIPEK